MGDGRWQMGVSIWRFMNSFPISLFSDGRVAGIPCSLGLMV